MIHIYTHSHYAHCLSLNYTFPQIVYINHVKEGDITHCCILWSLRRWGAHYVLELLLFCLFFTENLEGIWENLDFFCGLRLLDFGERNLRSF